VLRRDLTESIYYINRQVEMGKEGEVDVEGVDEVLFLTGR